MKTTRIIGRGLGFGLAALLGLATGAHAQGAYPNKPVKLISDSAAGSSNDVTIRVLADHFGQLWGQQVQVLNHPGAGGGISARIAAQAEPDGYTLYVPRNRIEPTDLSVEVATRIVLTGGLQSQ